MTSTAKDPAEARKRRKEIIQSQRSDGEAAAAIATTAAAAAASATTVALNESLPASPLTEGALPPGAAGAEKKPPKKRKLDAAAEAEAARKKTQIRYDPEVPMSKEQLAAWRREARRVRNRESAAASRQRIRNRISELEDEVGEWKNRYAHAMQRLEALQQADADGSG
ncbi:MAG: hypothetical protein SGBAC_012863, partial [Bacillariaceae sp.]